MHRKMYNYNQSEVSRNGFRRLRKNTKKAVCVTVATATMLTSIPYVTGSDTYAKEAIVREWKANGSVSPIENAITYDLSDASRITDKEIIDFMGETQTVKIQEINITQDGNYIITGSNQINGAYVDVHITVAEGVTANVTFDGAQIVNDDRYFAGPAGSGRVDYESLFPVIDIAGTANIYVQTDSSITSPAADESAVFGVIGTMKIKDLGTEAKLTLKAGKNEDPNLDMWIDYCVISGRDQQSGQEKGTFCMEGGTVELDGTIEGLSRFCVSGGILDVTESPYGSLQGIEVETIEMSGGILTYTTERGSYGSTIIEATHSFLFSGGTICCNIASGKANVFADSEISQVSGGQLLLNGNLSCYAGDPYQDAYGNDVFLYELTELPVNKKVKSINGQEVADTKTNDKGSVALLLPKCDALIVMEDNSQYVYHYTSETEIFVKDTSDSPSVHTLTLQGIRAGEKQVTVADGFCLKEYYDDGTMRYAYDDRETEGADITVTEDQIISLKEMEYTVTIDGEAKTMKYGETLPAGKFYLGNGSYSNYVGVYMPGSAVYKSITLSTISLEQEDGIPCVAVKSVEDMEKVSYLSSYISNLNIRLETDLDYAEKGRTSTLLRDEYAGTFDGNGHTIANVSCYSNSICTINLRGTIKNLSVKNCAQNWSLGEGRGGVICKNNYGIIENCMIEGVTVTTCKAKDNPEPDDYYERVKENGVFAGGNFGTIQSCYAYKCSFEGEGEVLPFGKQFGKSELSNCYFQAETGEYNAIDEAYRKTKEQFASGDVCYLLNQGVTDGSQSWYQNLGGEGADEKPLLKSTTTHGTVYATFDSGCTTKGYSNAPSTSKASHTLAYTADENVLTAICEEDAKHKITVTLEAEDVVYDGEVHDASMTVKCSDTWMNADIPDYEIVYKRAGNLTTDLRSVGTIEASVTAGGATAVLRYTIEEAPAEPTKEPAVTNTPNPTKAPAVTSTPSPTKAPAVTSTPSPTKAPAVTSTPSPTKAPAVTSTPSPTKAPAVTSTPSPTKEPAMTSTPNPTSTAPATVEGSNPAVTEKPTSATQKENAGQSLFVGKVLTSSKGESYCVTKKTGATWEVSYKAVSSKKVKTVSVPKTVKIKGLTYKVTSIAPNAFAGCKKLKRVTIGANITLIGEKAFYGCGNLKKIIVKTKKLWAENVGEKVFSKIHKKAVVKVPKKKKKEYKKWLKQRGIVGKRRIIS